MFVLNVFIVLIYLKTIVELGGTGLPPIKNAISVAYPESLKSSSTTATTNKKTKSLLQPLKIIHL